MNLSNGRQTERQTMNGDVRLREPGRPRYPASILDLSTGGCRIEIARTMQVGDHCWIGLPGIESLPARVRWTDGWTAGVSFEHTLHPSVLALIASRMGCGS
ncbi:PilZ domain-containing protein [Sphingomicrobium nitratireducens]|uniref:PilZ domain-containing protein n=1 Tax=Sphingomicrobium nitratireducens TaxID=2964666 RepID=UPI002240766D|nr:PilZ domain-containing protein [Sphingomicrobium nitratireducens]